jgi:hypothetical protein
MPLFCLGRNVMVRPPWYAHGYQETDVGVEAFPPPVHHRAEGRAAAAPSRGQGAGLEARALVARFVAHDNTVRLHGAIGYITPADFLAGRGPAIWAARDAKLEAAREARRARRAAAREASIQIAQPRSCSFAGIM